VSVALALVAIGLLGAAPARATPADDAAAALASAPDYVSPAAKAIGASVTAPALGDGVKVAVVAAEEGNAGQLSSAILGRLTTAGVPVQTVGVVRFDRTGVDEFHAVSVDGAPFCKGGADLAARRALTEPADTDLDALLARFADELAKLPPDRGESSCASAEAQPAHDDRAAWLWWLLAALVGVVGIGGFALYSHRTVQARRAAGEEEPEQEGWISVDYEEPDDSER
jgi:hypothetical protein